MKRFTKALALFCVFLFAITLFAQTNKQPKMAIDQEIYNVGEIYRTGRNIEHAFTIRNTGNTDLNIISVTPG